MASINVFKLEIFSTSDGSMMLTLLLQTMMVILISQSNQRSRSMEMVDIQELRNKAQTRVEENIQSVSQIWAS